ncbi:MAG: hypothetical protein ACRDRH_21225 [Pseudonocardia sp.]
MSSTLSRPRFWLVIGLEWPAQATGQHAECAFAIAPSFIPKGVLSPSAYAIFELSKAVVPAGEQQVVMFSELTQTLRRNSADWAKVGVPDWEATLGELAEAPVPSLYLSLSQYAHVMGSTAGMDNSYVYRPGWPPGTHPRAEAVPAAGAPGMADALPLEHHVPGAKAVAHREPGLPAADDDHVPVQPIERHAVLPALLTWVLLICRAPAHRGAMAGAFPREQCRVTGEPEDDEEETHLGPDRSKVCSTHSRRPPSSSTLLLREVEERTEHGYSTSTNRRHCD